MKTHLSEKRKTIIKHAVIFFVLLIYVIVLSLTELDCPFRMLFDIPCPFCGMTTAYVAFFSGNFAEAFRAHPLFLLAPLLIFLAFHKRLFPKIPQKLCDTVLILCSVMFFVFFIYRLY